MQNYQVVRSGWEQQRKLCVNLYIFLPLRLFQLLQRQQVLRVNSVVLVTVHVFAVTRQTHQHNSYQHNSYNTLIHSLVAARKRLWVVAPSMLTGHQQEPMQQ